MTKQSLHAKNHPTGVTLIELMVALAIMVLLMATLLPMFAALRRTWSVTIADAESTQKARVLFDHLHRQLTQAQQILALSDPEDPHGWLVFRDVSGDVRRYEMTPGQGISFGEPAVLADLVTPVDSFCIQGYDLSDLRHPIRDRHRIRVVDVQVVFPENQRFGRRPTWQSTFFLRATGLDARQGDPAIAEHWVRAESPQTD
jgi:prepilin-type N-terminal cleavage/methylation domain-containing protein